MNFNELIAEHGVFAATFIVCFLSGFIPVINAEAYLVAVAALTSTSAAPPVVLLATLGQMTAKSIIYLAGRGILKVPLGKYEKQIEKAREKFERWKNKSDIFIFISGFIGLPPFYIISMLAGTFEIPFIRFFVAGFIGRSLRFGIAVYAPHLIKVLIA